MTRCSPPRGRVHRWSPPRTHTEGRPLFISRIALLIPHGRQIRRNATNHYSVKAYDVPSLVHTRGPDLPTTWSDHRGWAKTHIGCVQLVGSRGKGKKPDTPRRHDTAQVVGPTARRLPRGVRPTQAADPIAHEPRGPPHEPGRPPPPAWRWQSRRSQPLWRRWWGGGGRGRPPGVPAASSRSPIPPPRTAGIGTATNFTSRGS